MDRYLVILQFELCACCMALRCLNPNCKVAVKHYFWLEGTSDLICVAIKGRIRKAMSNTALPQDRGIKGNGLVWLFPLKKLYKPSGVWIYLYVQKRPCLSLFCKVNWSVDLSVCGNWLWLRCVAIGERFSTWGSWRYDDLVSIFISDDIHTKVHDPWLKDQITCLAVVLEHWDISVF